MKELPPQDSFEFRKGAGDVLVIACGALARELIALVETNGWRHLDIQCLPAIWHNTPEKIPEGVRDAIHKAARSLASIARCSWPTATVAPAACSTR
jgi:hypothetical protein